MLQQQSQRVSSSQISSSSSTARRERVRLSWRTKKDVSMRNGLKHKKKRPLSTQLVSSIRRKQVKLRMLLQRLQNQRNNKVLANNSKVQKQQSIIHLCQDSTR